jgi:NADPH-dependent 2,4-dienoyl-CoA reductase/sulfur reductase-like enzyme
MGAKNRIVIIGNGAAGNSAAEALRSIDSEADIKIISDEPFMEYSPCLLPDYIAGELNKDKVFIKNLPDYSSLQIDLLLDKRVEAVDTINRCVLLSRTKIPYDSLILATGSYTFIPPIDGIADVSPLSLKTFNDAEKILGYAKHRKFLIVGGGVIGVELSIALRKRGCEVSIVEVAKTILSRVFSLEMAADIKAALEEHGIHVFEGETVLEFKKEKNHLLARTNARELRCDAVIIAAGSRPNVSLAKQAGIKLGKLGGVHTDNRMETDRPNVFACGDCVQSTDVVTGQDGLSMLWGNAILQGKIAGLNCAGHKKSYLGSMNFVRIGVFGYEALSMGNILPSVSDKRGREILRWDRQSLKIRYHFLEDRFSGLESFGIVQKAGRWIKFLLKETKMEDVKGLLAKKMTVNSLGPFDR